MYLSVSFCAFGGAKIANNVGKEMSEEIFASDIKDY